MNRGKTVKILIFLFLFILYPVFSLFAEPGKPTYIWKVGTLAPKGVGWAIQVAEIVEPAVKESSNGDIATKIYWGGVLGDDEAILQKMKEGKIQVGGLTAMGAIQAAKQFAVLELPFLFNDYSEVDYIRDKMFNIFAGFLKENGFTLYLWVDQDFDQLYSVKSPLSSLAEFKGLKFASWHGILEKRLIESLGSVPIPTRVPDISGSIRSGKTDAVIAPAIWVVGAQLYSTIRYINPMKIRYSPAIIIVDNRTWDEIPGSYKDKAIEMRKDLTKRFVAGTRRDNEKSIQAMESYGLKLTSISIENKRVLEARAKGVWKEMAGSLYPMSLLNEITDNLDEFRNTQK